MGTAKLFYANRLEDARDLPKDAPSEEREIKGEGHSLHLPPLPTKCCFLTVFTPEVICSSNEVVESCSV